MKTRILNCIHRYTPSTCFLGLIVISIIHNKKIIFIVTLFAIFLYECIKTVVCHKGALDIISPTPVEIKSQPYHPSVCFFKEGWNGYKYWMAFTPMPKEALPYPDRWENPCLVASMDGIM